MAIQYGLRENALRRQEGKSNYRAQVEHLGTARLDDIIRAMREGGCHIHEADAIRVLTALTETVKRLLLEGKRVHIDGLLELSTVVAGTFESVEQRLRSETHKVRVTAHAVHSLQTQIADEAELERVELTTPAPQLESFKDSATGNIDSTLSPGNIGLLYGRNLKYHQDREDEGLFLIYMQTAHTVRIQTLADNKPSCLMFKIPDDLQPGQYTMTVHARLNNTKDLRSGKLDFPLNV